jgi:ERCC4-type nuclease
MPVKTLHSAIINCIYRDGICVCRNRDVSETSDLLVSIATKFLTCSDPLNDFSKKGDLVPNEIDVPIAKKRGTITRIEGFQRILCQIPSISNTKASALVDHFKTPDKLFNSLQNIKGDDHKEVEKTRLSLISQVRLNNGSKLGPASAQKIIYFLGFSEFEKKPVEPKKKSCLNT